MAKRAVAIKILVAVASVVAMLGGLPAARGFSPSTIPPVDADDIYRCTLLDLPMHDFSSTGLRSLSSPPGTGESGVWRTWDLHRNGIVSCNMEDRNAGQPDDDGDDDSGGFSPDAHLEKFEIDGWWTAYGVCADSVSFYPNLYVETPEGPLNIYFGLGGVTAQIATVDWEPSSSSSPGGSFTGTIQPGDEWGANPHACYRGSGSGTSTYASDIDWVSISGEMVFWSYDG